jgi:hypothetical protein
MKQHIFLDEWKKNFYNKSLNITNVEIIGSYFPTREGTNLSTEHRDKVHTINPSDHSITLLQSNRAENSISDSIQKDFLHSADSPQIIDPVDQKKIDNTLEKEGKVGFSNHQKIRENTNCPNFKSISNKKDSNPNPKLGCIIRSPLLVFNKLSIFELI